MTTLQLFSIIWLVVAFAVGIGRSVNIGLTTIPAAYVLALVAGLPAKAVFTEFPSKLVILVVGVMLLWGHVQRSGGIDLILRHAIRAADGRRWLLPWLMFLLTAIICAIGALPAAALAITLPLAMRMAQTQNIPLSLMALVTLQGSGAGGFSPISAWGKLIQQEATQQHVAFSALQFFAGEFVLSTVLAGIAFFLFGGTQLLGRASAEERAALDAEFSGHHRPVDGYQIFSLFALLAFILLVFFFGLNVGLTAFALSLVLQLLFRPDQKQVIGDVPWAVVLLVSGVLIYVGVLDSIGTLESIGQLVQHIPSASLVLLALAYVGTLFASFESSSIAVLGLVIPLTLRTIPFQGDTFAATLVLAAISGCVAAIITSPFHIGGGLALANSGEAQGRTFRTLLAWSLSVAIVLPLITFAVPVFERML